MTSDFYEGLKRSTFDTVQKTISNIKENRVVQVKVDSKAATRQSIILNIRTAGIDFKTRSNWDAKEARSSDGPDWDYHGIALHHAGNSFSCSANGVDQIRKAEKTDIDKFGHVSYHYAIDCEGTIFEALDIREKGAHISRGNTGVIGIVLLSDLTERGETYTQGYSKKTFFSRLKGIKDWGPDQVYFNHDTPSSAQVNALEMLVVTLSLFFPIKMIGGHREYQKLSNGAGRACPGNYGMELVYRLRSLTKKSSPYNT